jgi:hypothetical protein
VCECFESCHRAVVLCTGYQSYRRLLLSRRDRLVHTLRVAGAGHRRLAISASARMSLVSGPSSRPPLSSTYTSSPLTWRPGKFNVLVSKVTNGSVTAMLFVYISVFLIITRAIHSSPLTVVVCVCVCVCVVLCLPYVTGGWSQNLLLIH